MSPQTGDGSRGLTGSTAVRLADLEHMVSGLILVGEVEETDFPAAKYRVRIGEGDNSFLTDWLTVGTNRAGKVRETRHLSVGERVVILNPDGRPENGFIAFSLFAPGDGQGTPNGNEPQYELLFPDGTFIKYDHDAHAYTLKVPDAGGTMLMEVGSQIKALTKKFVVEADEIEHTSKKHTITTEELVVQASKTINMASMLATTIEAGADFTVTAGGAASIQATAMATLQGASAVLQGAVASMAVGTAGTMEGDLSLEGQLQATQDLIAGTISLLQHIHKDAENRETTPPTA